MFASYICILLLHAVSRVGIQWRSEGGGRGGGGGGQLPLGTDLRGAPKCLDVYYKYHCNAYRIISRGKAYVNALMFID